MINNTKSPRDGSSLSYSLSHQRNQLLNSDWSLWNIFTFSIHTYYRHRRHYIRPPTDVYFQLNWHYLNLLSLFSCKVDLGLTKVGTLIPHQACHFVNQFQLFLTFLILSNQLNCRWLVYSWLVKIILSFFASACGKNTSTLFLRDKNEEMNHPL